MLGAGRDFREYHVSEVPAPIAIELSSATICSMGIIYEEFFRAVRTVNRSISRPDGQTRLYGRQVGIAAFVS